MRIPDNKQTNELTNTDENITSMAEVSRSTRRQQTSIKAADLTKFLQLLIFQSGESSIESSCIRIVIQISTKIEWSRWDIPPFKNFIIIRLQIFSFPAHKLDIDNNITYSSSIEQPNYSSKYTEMLGTWKWFGRNITTEWERQNMCDTACNIYILNCVFRA